MRIAVKELIENLVTSICGSNDKLINKYVTAAVSKDLKKGLSKHQDQMLRERYLSGQKDKVEHIYSWISSAMRTDNLYHNNPDHPEAERVQWIHDIGQNGAPKKLNHGTIEKLYEEAEQWSRSRQAKINIQDLTENTTTVMDFCDDFKIVQLHKTDDLRREGNLMGHCVGDGAYDYEVENGDLEVYSLRDFKNQPHCTIGVRNGVVDQSKGKSNDPPIAKYMPYIQKFFNERQYKLDEEFSNTGMVEIDGVIYPLEDVPDGTHFQELDLRDCSFISHFPENITINFLKIGSNKNRKENYSNTFFQTMPALKILAIINYDDEIEEKVFERAQEVRIWKVKNLTPEKFSENYHIGNHIEGVSFYLTKKNANIERFNP